MRFEARRPSPVPTTHEHASIDEGRSTSVDIFPRTREPRTLERSSRKRRPSRGRDFLGIVHNRPRLPLAPTARRLLPPSPSPLSLWLARVPRTVVPLGAPSNRSPTPQVHGFAICLQPMLRVRAISSLFLCCGQPNYHDSSYPRRHPPMEMKLMLCLLVKGVAFSNVRSSRIFCF